MNKAAEVLASQPWEKVVPASRLRPNPDNPREDFGDLAGLAESIRSGGLRTPLLVRQLDGTGGYEIIDGERRWRAMRDWLTMIPVVIRPLLPGEAPAVQNITTALVTGHNRKDLGPIEKAKAFERLLAELGTQAAVCEATGFSSAAVTNSLALLELSEQNQAEVASGKMTVKDALHYVRRHRARTRKKEGKASPAPAWEPPVFTKRHPLGRKAASMCDARGHTRHRRLHPEPGYAGGCEECWETVLRADQQLVDAETARAAAVWRELQQARQQEERQVT